MEPIKFVLPDGGMVSVSEEEMRRVYEALWDLSDLPGAVSTAAVLLHESRQPLRYRHPVELTAAQGEAIRRAVARFANPS